MHFLQLTGKQLDTSKHRLVFHSTIPRNRFSPLYYCVLAAYACDKYPVDYDPKNDKPWDKKKLYASDLA